MDFFDKLNAKADKDEIKKKVAGGVILNKDNKILLLKRKKNDFMGGIYELPSGNLETGETIKEGLIREIKEETSLNVIEVGMFINTFDYLSGSGKKSRQFNFEVKVENIDVIFLTEHDEYQWVTFEEAESKVNLTDEVKYTLNILKYNKNVR